MLQKFIHRPALAIVVTLLLIFLGALAIEGAAPGARVRFRPILMTSFAFISGLLPWWWRTDRSYTSWSVRSPKGAS